MLAVLLFPFLYYYFFFFWQRNVKGKRKSYEHDEKSKMREIFNINSLIRLDYDSYWGGKSSTTYHGWWKRSLKLRKWNIMGSNKFFGYFFLLCLVVLRAKGEKILAKNVCHLFGNSFSCLFIESFFKSSRVFFLLFLLKRTLVVFGSPALKFLYLMLTISSPKQNF